MGQTSSNCPRSCCQDSCKPSDWCNKEKNTVKVDPAIVSDLNGKHAESQHTREEKGSPPKCNDTQGANDDFPMRKEVVSENVVHPESIDKDQTPDETDPEDEPHPVKEQKMPDCTGGVWASDEEEQLQEAIRASLREQGIVQNGVQNHSQSLKNQEDGNLQKSAQEQADLDALLAASLAYEDEEIAGTHDQECHSAPIKESKMETTTADPEEDHERACMVQSFLTSNGFKDINALIRKPINKVRPLHVAVRKADSSLVESLIWSGADPYLLDGKGQTPLELARKLNKGNSQKKVITILEATN